MNANTSSNHQGRGHLENEFYLVFGPILSLDNTVLEEYKSHFASSSWTEESGKYLFLECSPSGANFTSVF
jgi:hypothetical protein